MQPSYAHLIGIPYEVADCWGVAVRFYKDVLDTELKNYYDVVPNDVKVTNNLIHSNKGDFVEVFDRQFGDIILIRLEGVEAHIAIFLGRDKILHTQKKTGCIIERIGRWEKRIVGFYRIKQ